MAEGVNIFVDGGVLKIGENFYSNRNLLIQCGENVAIGNNVLVGWNVSIRDTDGHLLADNDKDRAESEKIVIEDDVWIAADVTILKGTQISKGSITACNSVVHRLKMIKPNCMIAGIPAVVKREGIVRKS